MFWFKKKKKPEIGDEVATEDDAPEEKPREADFSGNLEVEFTKIKSQIEALNEVRKASAEQFTRTSEQIGELRGALMDSNKAISVIEVASTKAIDMVNSVQPDKLMVEVRKVDGKIEALRANIEANESIMKDIMIELKSMRSQMNFYKGVDQIVKLNNEIKQELIDIKKTEGLVSKHADRVETIFVEVEKKFYDFDKFNDVVKGLDRSFKKISSDFDKMRVGVEGKADKKEFVKLVDKFSDFEKHTTNILKLLDQKSRNTVTDLNSLFDKLKGQLEKKYDTKIDVKGIADESLMESVDALSGSDKKDVKKESTESGTREAGSPIEGEASSEKKEKKEEAPSEKKGLFGMFKKKEENAAEKKE